MANRHAIRFDHSAIDATADYMQKPSETALRRLVCTLGCKLAYRHHLWSSPGLKVTIEEFWKSNLKLVNWNENLRTTVSDLVRHLESEKQSHWLDEVLRYLPRDHVFNTTVYLILGYDNIVYVEDVALNLNHAGFHVDQREAVYYLIHELAHAGYFRYHRMPNLMTIRTQGDLLDVVKLLTHLEGMGVLSSLRLRIKEGGLNDEDYNVLLDTEERARRVKNYFRELERLEGNPRKRIHEKDFEVFERMSGKNTRLWYVAGCHMAQTIESELGTDTLRALVKEGHQRFFEVYKEIALVTEANEG